MEGTLLQIAASALRAVVSRSPLKAQRNPQLATAQCFI